MKTNISEQGSVWQAAFADGLARGEAAFGAGHCSALAFAETYAFVVEAEQMKAASDASQEAVLHQDKPDWAKAFNQLG